MTHDSHFGELRVARLTVHLICLVCYRLSPAISRLESRNSVVLLYNMHSIVLLYNTVLYLEETFPARDHHLPPMTKTTIKNIIIAVYIDKCSTFLSFLYTSLAGASVGSPTAVGG